SRSMAEICTAPYNGWRGSNSYHSGIEDCNMRIRPTLGVKRY
ncbi:hypothetical protein A2U01_0065448, partial [Trifolium medium]|nr:hypothetical protein [Trifolium medium]